MQHSATSNHPTPSRRAHPIVAALTVAFLILAAFDPTPAVSVQPGAIAPTSPSIRYSFVQVASGLDFPVYATHAGDGRMFIVEQKSGKVKVLQNGAILPTPLVSIPSEITTSNEEGLIGLAFEPDFANTRRFYIFFAHTSGYNVLRRYTTYITDTNKADPLSARSIISIPHTLNDYHLGGWIGFGPGGYLYLTTGDAGEWSACPSQKPTELRGKILRLNVVGQITYTTPASNIFTTTQRPEVFAMGLRNPWRASFDRATGDLYVGDVGENNVEEVSLLPSGAAAGMSFGWPRFEGLQAFSPPGSSCNGFLGPVSPTRPIISYTHASGASVTGGHVYRGERQPWLEGVYFYGDYVYGTIRAAWRSGTGFATGQITDTNWFISSFAEDAAGELYVVSRSNSYGGTTGQGRIFRIESRLPRNAFVPGTEREFERDW